MDTTQRNSQSSAPRSAQQRNGAVRSAEEQRGSAPEGAGQAAPRQRREARPEQPAARKNPASGQKPEGARRSAAAQTKQAAPQKKTAPQKPREDARKKQPSGTKAQQTGKKKTSLFGLKKTPASRSAKETEKAPQPARRKAEPKQEPAYTRGLPDSVSTKKRAYGNSKPKKKNALDLVNDAVKRSGERKAEKIKQRQAEMEKGPRKKNRPQQPAPTVIYTQPVAFNASRLLVQLVTVTAVVAALVMGLSIFFKVKTIEVSGAEVYSTWRVREESGIEEGDNLLTFSHARAGAQIKANLPYVKSVRFGIKLPDTVNIIIEEEDVVYAIKTQDGTWWLMNSSGRMIEQTNNSVAARYTQVVGVTVTDPVPNERGVATESAAVYETNEANETVPVPVSVTGAQRLNTALQILQALEDNDIVGEAASVDVTRLEDIILWYGSQYQVNLGNSTNLAYKIACMNDVILQMSEYQSGVLDISFTIWPNQVGYTPFG